MSAAARGGGVPWTRWRRLCQLAVAALYLALPFAATTWLTGTFVALRVGPVDLVEPATGLSAALASRALPAALLLGVAPVLLLALALGPVYCSWACPYGLLSELLDRLRPRRAARWSGTPWRAARVTRTASLTVLLAASLVLGLPVAALLAPPRLVTALPLELRAAGALPVVTAVLLAVVLAVEVLGPRRLVCRALCPAGALAVLLRNRRTLGPRFEPGRCRCALPAPCFHGCPWGVDPREAAPRDGCTTCLACVERCPTGALRVSAGAAAGSSAPPAPGPRRTPPP